MPASELRPEFDPEDVVELPGVAQDVIDSLPVAVGWGEPRISEVLELLDLLSGLEPEVISYTPDGFDITFDGVSVYTPSVAALRASFGAVVRRSTTDSASA